MKKWPKLVLALHIVIQNMSMLFKKYLGKYNSPSRMSHFALEQNEFIMNVFISFNTVLKNLYRQLMFLLQFGKKTNSIGITN